MVDRKGIILAGGSGTRLYPSTKAVSKQILPIFDKPMIFYSLSALMLAGIRDILVISTPRDLVAFRELLEPLSEIGLRLSFAEQRRPEGIAQALLIGEEFIDGKESCLILGDNMFYGDRFSKLVQDAGAETDGATVLAYEVKDPERYGVVTLDENNKATSIVEKPANPQSRFAVTGFYFYDKDAVEIAKSIKPSARGELEITAVNEAYLQRGKLNVKVMGRGYAWLDTGTHDSLLDASNFVATIERRQGRKIGCVEEIAWRQGWVDNAGLRAAAEAYKASDYGRYLFELIEA